MKKTLQFFLLSLMLMPSVSFAALDFDPKNPFPNTGLQLEVGSQQNAINTGNNFSGSNANSNGLSFNTSGGGGCTQPKDIGTLFEYGICVLSGSVIPFIFGLALLLFLVGVVRFVSAGDNEEKREGGRDMMIFGIVCLFVMVSVWGFVKLLTASFGFNFELPSLPKQAPSTYMK